MGFRVSTSLIVAIFAAAAPNVRARPVRPQGSHAERTNVIEDMIARMPKPTDFDCPRGIDSVAADDDKKGLFAKDVGRTINESCLKGFDTFGSAKDFEAFLAKHPTTHVPGLKADHLSRCYGGASVSAAKDRVADYYYAETTLLEGARNYLDAATAIDMTLGGGDTVAHDLYYYGEYDFFWKFFLPGMKDYSYKIMDKCRPGYIDPQHPELGTVAMKDMVDKTVMALNLHRDIEAKLRSDYITPERQAKLSKKNFIPKHYRNIPAGVGSHESAYDKIAKEREDSDPLRDQYIQESRRELEAADKYILSQVPWLQGKFMKDLIGQDKVSEATVRSLLDKQLRDNRRLLKQQLFEIRHASQCLYFSESSMDDCPQQILKTVNSLPGLDNRIFLNEESEEGVSKDRRDALGSTSTHMIAAQCRMKQRSFKKDYDSAIDGFVSDMVFLAVTLGLGEIVSGSKALLALGKISKLSTAAEVARALVWGSDATMAVLGANEAVKTCDAALNQRLAGVPSRLDPNSRDPSCATSSGLEAQSVSDASTCYMAAAAAAVGVLPALPGTLKLLKGFNASESSKLFTPKLRSQISEEVTKALARDLGTETRQASRQGLHALEVLDHLNATRFTTGAEAKLLPELLAKAEKSLGRSLNASETAKLIEKLDKPGLEGLMHVLDDAHALMKNKPTLGPARAFEEALNAAPEISGIAGKEWRKDALACLVNLVGN